MSDIQLVRAAAEERSTRSALPALPWPAAGRHAARYLAGVAVLAVLYRGVAEVGYSLQFAGPIAAIVWLPVGVGVAFLYLGGLRFWPGVLVGDLLANDYGALPLGSAVGQTVGNVLEVVVAAGLLLRLVPHGDPLESVGGLGRLLLAIGVGAAVSATVGTCSLLVGGALDTEHWPSAWRTWWLGDTCGALVMLPIAVAWAGSPVRWWRVRPVETVFVLAAVAVLSQFALHTSEPLTYLVLPALVWAGLRLARPAVTLAVAVAGGFAIWETTRRVGPFAFGSSAHSVLATQLYLAVSTLTALFVSAVVSERRTFAERLAASRARLVEAGAAERRRIERDLHDGAQQRLTALAVRLSLAADQVRPQSEAMAARFDAAGQELSDAIEELRELAHGIHPSALGKLGLADALRLLAAQSPTPIRLLEVPGGRVDAPAELTAYFVVSEAIANAHKHAGARSIAVRASASRDRMRVEVTDDGRGGATESGGSGLRGLRGRVEAIGGSLAIESAEGSGTRIAAVLPSSPTGR